MSDDDLDRAAILARRQRFIAIALSSLAVACTGRGGKPQPCLSPPMPQTEDGSQGEPEPEDAHDDAATAGVATDGETPEDPPPESAVSDAAPQVCLMVLAPR